MKKMNRRYCVLLSIFICQVYTMLAQECAGKQELQSSIQQVHKLLSAQEASYLQSLRTLRKKLNLLQYSVAHLPAKPKNFTCPNLDTPVNGRKLGTVLLPGHDVHFLCDVGYELVGSETRRCKDSLSWTGQQPLCKVFVSITNTSSASTGAEAASSFPLTQSAFTWKSKCSQVQGTTLCTCEPGYTISGRDNSICTDIDECKLFHNGQAGRLCLHSCVNTPGGYRCTCPAGYIVTQDGRSCKDIDECSTRQNNCTRDQLCINTYGGFQCVKVDCPHIRNATYVKTSPVRCERNPCPVDSMSCSQAPNSVSYHHMSVVSNLSTPRVMFRVSAVRMIGDTLRFALLGGRIRRYFTVQRSDRQTGELLLVSPVQGPVTLEVEVEMTELERRELLGRYITRITIFVSQYEF
ncbi:fibulin-7 isoform X2 [Myxocyprinus asiaticus]|uniref:fibulin-7 isoform X2 n=1 Tax=Myxocyprinus asiaticus TaxID=70543 RepID=UPI002223429A|nr:fibulin-7 isoform X2 [Myxocyprinus asiaticus]